MYTTTSKLASESNQSRPQIVVRAPVLYETPDLGIFTTAIDEKTHPQDQTLSKNGWGRPVTLAVRAMVGVHKLNVTVAAKISALKQRLVEEFKVRKGFVLCYPQVGMLHPDMTVSGHDFADSISAENLGKVAH